MKNKTLYDYCYDAFCESERFANFVGSEKE